MKACSLNLIKSYRAGVFGLGACLSVALAACSGAGTEWPDGEPSDVATTGPQQPMTFEEYKAKTPFNTSINRWIVEGDLHMNEAELRDYFDRTVSPSGALIIDVNGTAISRWSNAQKRNIRYCIANAFTGNKARMVEAMRRATAAWENVADVRFVYLSGQDSNCTNTNTNVDFNVAPFSRDKELAASFFPHWARSSRFLQVNVPLILDDYAALLSLEGVLRHELGHALGFRHEHIRNLSAPQDCREPEDTSWYALNPYDNLSVMHYPNFDIVPCPGRPSTAGDLFLSHRDMAGAALVYDAPTNVAGYGTRVFARNRANGDIHERVVENNLAIWKRSTGPMRYLVATESAIYGMNATGTYMNTSGTTWTRIGDGGGHLFQCGYTQVCRTLTTNDEPQMYTPETPPGTNPWVRLGPAYRKYAWVVHGLYAQTPDRNQVKFIRPFPRDIATGHYEDIIGGRSLYLVDEGSGYINVLNSDFRTQTQIGPSAAQFVGGATTPAGGFLYRLRLDRSAVDRYNNTAFSWTSVGGSQRLYMIGNVLYGQDLNNGNIWRYSDDGALAFSQLMGQP